MIVVYIADIDTWNPAFDVTPAALITGGIITEKGVVQAPIDTPENMALLQLWKCFSFFNIS